MTAEATPVAAPLAAPAVGPVAVLGEGLTVAAGSSRLLRRGSIYIGLLMLALVGPGIVAGLALVGSGFDIDFGSAIDEDAATDVVRAGLLLFVAFIGSVVVVVEGSAIGIALIAGRVLNRPVSLRDALARSRRVFWRIIRAGFVVGIVQVVASHLWQVATGKATIFDLENLMMEPIPAAIAVLPYLYSTVAIVLADDGAVAALRRSSQIATRAKRLTIALGAFGLLSGVIQTFALSSGLDLIIRLTTAMHLDITAGGPSLVIAGAIALAVVMAAGSLLFTVGALVSAPQIVAWSRLGLPLDGLPVRSGGLPVEALDVELAPAPEPLLAAESVPTADPEPTAEPVVAAEPRPALEPAAPIDSTPTLEPSIPAPAPVSAWAAAAAPQPSAWEVNAAKEQPFRWVTLPMRFTVIGMWLIAIAAVIAAAPG